jgi:hypothetical protein
MPKRRNKAQKTQIYYRRITSRLYIYRGSTTDYSGQIFHSF